MSPSTPKVSIVAAVYNCETTLPETIESVLQQTYSDFELILVDDGSKDGTAAVAQKYATRDPRIRLVMQAVNCGQTVSLNRGLLEARGQYIARIDGDDLMLPQRLERQVAALENNPALGLVGSDVQVIDSTGAPIAVYHLPHSDTEIRRLLPKQDPIYHPAVMFRRDLLWKAGIYHFRYRYAQDYCLWIRMSRFCQMENLPEVLLKYRVSAGAISRKTVRGQAWETVLILLDAILKGFHSPIQVLHLWKPMVYVLAPRVLIEWRFQYRDRRDRKRGQYSFQ